MLFFNVSELLFFGKFISQLYNRKSLHIYLLYKNTVQQTRAGGCLSYLTGKKLMILKHEEEIWVMKPLL